MLKYQGTMILAFSFNTLFKGFSSNVFFLLLILYFFKSQG